MNASRNAVHVLLLLLLPTWCAAQAVVSGKVTAAEGGQALVGVSVFVPELGLGTATDSAGVFRLLLQHRGSFLIQFTHVGMESAFRSLPVTDAPVVLDMTLRASRLELKEVNVIGTQISAPRETSRSVEVLSAKEIRERGALSVSDAVAKLPGASQLTTGVGISKPVIRGLYGNRVQVNLLGLRFDNQQWQDEHGLGLGADGVDRVEVIKGAAALQYGSDAIGGVLNVIDERPAPLDSLEQDARLQIFSNTRGVSAGYGVRKSSASAWWRVHGGADSHADYSSANDTRVINSRFASYSLKAAAGFRNGRWTSTNSTLLSFSQFGFVFDTLSREVVDGRASRSFDGPHHTVMLGVFSSENTYYGDRMKWKVNAGWISNKRQEQEGGNKISLDMLLNSASLAVQSSIPIGAYGTWTNGVSFLFQTNTNIGSRVIIPDATTLEGSVFSYVRRTIGRCALEGGLRADLRNIDAVRTLTLDQPFDKTWTALNGSIGLAWDPVEELNLKANVSSGYRSGNLAELGSNGLHEGTHRWEIGDPDLRIEQNLCAEAGFTYEWMEQVEIGASVYHNAFNDYIYLKPTGADTLGLAIYRYVQSDATLQGGEATLDVHPKAMRWADITAGVSHIDAEQGDGSPLPFIPADRLSLALKLIARESGWLRIGADQVFAQDEPAQFETSTPTYLLWSASAGTALAWNDHALEIAVVCNNLTDERYVDHLSRFKYFGLYDIGRNISLSLHLQF